MPVSSAAGPLAGVLLLGGLVGTLPAQQPSAPVTVAATPVATVAHARDEFAGTWDYNAAESINIQTNRPEQAPRSATQRAVRSEPSVASVPPSSRERGGGGGDGSSGRIGPTAEMMRETQDLSRDLLEVPESLKISVTATAVVITDDLERERMYRTDGTKQKHRLGAAEFEARMEFQDSQLRKSIEGSYGFRMTETYFLSPDGRRLFVMVRVGQPRRDAPQVGFNRVYDRVE